MPVIAGQADAEGAFWYSGRGDNIDATLTREVDLTGLATATLTFRAWYDIEEQFDYAYVAVSTDGGRTWEALPGDHTTTDDPLGVSYGPGYTGSSEGWVEERVDLTPYAGSPVLLRFELVTDDSMNGAGLALDGVAVPEAGLFDDAESDIGEWHREGFRRVSGPLEQRFELRLITIGSAARVEAVALDGQNDATIDLSSLGSDYGTAVLVVVAVTDGTGEKGRYSYEVAAAP